MRDLPQRRRAKLPEVRAARVDRFAIPIDLEFIIASCSRTRDNSTGRESLKGEVVLEARKDRGVLVKKTVRGGFEETGRWERGVVESAGARGARDRSNI